MGAVSFNRIITLKMTQFFGKVDGICENEVPIE